jgi:ribonuclease Y
MDTYIYAIVGVALGFIVGFLVRKYIAEARIATAENAANKILEEANREAESRLREALVTAKEEIHGMREEFEQESKERRSEIKRMEDRMLKKEEMLDNKNQTLEKKEEQITKKNEKLKQKLEEAESYAAKQSEELERIARMTTDEARDTLFDIVKKDVRQDSAVFIREAEARAKDEADKKAREIITTAIQRCAADHVTETTVSVVELPNDEMKGRIIGREGRNIRAFETLTGVDLIIDDTPEAVVLSSFDPVKREVARLSLERLVSDGRIHPARIEEMIERAKNDVNNIIREEGEQAAFEAGIHNLHPELIKLLGRLKYRTSYGQNMLSHSLEVAHLCGLMAAELNMNIKLAKRAGLLHDIGKALDHEVEGTHSSIGADVLKKYNEPKEVIHAAASHHGDIQMIYLEDVLVQAADAISAARPGARRESLESYIKRLETLEEIATSIEGVDKSFAIQAGREIRIMVKPEMIDDNESALIAREVSKKIEEGLEYPGHIKVTVIRETRAVEYAK